MPTPINTQINTATGKVVQTPGAKFDINTGKPLVANPVVPISPVPPSSNNTPATAGISGPVNTGYADALSANTTAQGMTTSPTTGDRSSATAMFQSEIDALNQVYTQQKAAETIAGNNRLGSNAAIEARRGLLGSDFGAAATDNQVSANKDAQDAIDAKHNLDISAVFGKISQSALDMAKARVDATQKGAAAKLEEIKGRQSQVASDLSAAAKAYIASGHDGSNISTTDIQNIVDTYKKNGFNVSSDQVLGAFKDAADTAAKGKLDTLKTQTDIDNSKAQLALDTKYKTGMLSVEQYKAQTDRLKATTSGSAAGISPELQAAINAGQIDPNKINSRTLGIYESIAKAGVDAVGAHAGAAGETKAVTDLVSYKSVAQRTLNTIDANLPLVADLADKVNQTGVPGLDSYISGVKAYTGNNSDVIKYVNSLKTLRSEYAQMLSKGGVATEGDKAEAANAIPAGLNGDTYRSLGVQLKLEANNILKASDDAIQSAKNKSASNNGAQSSSVNIGGTNYTVGSVIQNAKGQTGIVNADGSITPQ